MELMPRFRVLAALAAIAVVGAVGLTRPAVSRAADPPWDPPPCPPGPVPPLGQMGAWYALDPEIDASGWLRGRSLSLGDLDGRGSRRMDLPPESFASGPIHGRVLVGDDDGTRSRLRLVDITAGCATEIGRETSVVRSAVMSADGRSAWEHRVDRATRTDEGIWRRPLDGGPSVRVLPGLAPDARFGPTFATELLLVRDGRLAVSSCGERRCRIRTLDPRTGRVDLVEGTGPLVGVAGDRVVAYAACHGFPCRIESFDLRAGRRTILVAAGGPAVLGGPGGWTLVHQALDGSLQSLDLRTLRRARVAGPAPASPVRGGSAATSGADVPEGWLLLAPEGHLADRAAARGLDVAAGVVRKLTEVAP